MLRVHRACHVARLLREVAVLAIIGFGVRVVVEERGLSHALGVRE
jgi:hypothetical protein